MKQKILWVSMLITFFVSNTLIAQSPDSIKTKAEKYFAEENYKEALREYGKLPASAETQKKIGIAHIKLWNMSAALRSLRQAEKLSPNDLSIKAAIAEAMSWNKDFDDAIELYKTIFSKGFNEIDARLTFARTLAWNKEYDNAISEYRVILKNDPSNYDAYIGLGQTLSWLKKFDASIETYQKAIANSNSGKEKSSATVFIAQIQSWQGELEKSVTSYEKALQLNKKNVEALFGLGEVNEWMSKYPTAKKHYEQILQIQPEHKAAKAKLLQLMWVK
jgi:tetratricopeptide (TPR) repeat protein